MGNGALRARAGGLTGTPAARGKLPPGPGRSQKQVAASQLARIHRATIELTAKSGYEALRVRDIVRRAELSTRAFYRHFDSKDDCFLQTYDRVARNALRRIAASQRGEPNWRKRAQLMLGQLIAEIESDPDAAHLVLIDAPTASPAAFERVQRTEQRAAELLRECLARPPQGATVPPLVAQGMVAGTLAVAKHRLEAERVDRLRASAHDLAAWALSYVDRSAVRLADLDRRSVWRNSTLEPRYTSRAVRNGSSPSTADRGHLLTAIADLVAADGYPSVTVPRIRASARVSRQGFHQHFEDVEACCIAALEYRVEDVIAHATRAKAAAASLPGGVYRAISAICTCIASDLFLTRLCTFGGFPSGSDGRRAHDRLVSALIEALSDGAPGSSKHDLLTEASTGAVWSVFRTHTLERASRSEEVAATLAYLVLTPTQGPNRTLNAISTEQHRSGH